MSTILLLIRFSKSQGTNAPVNGRMVNITDKSHLTGPMTTKLEGQTTHVGPSIFLPETFGPGRLEQICIQPVWGEWPYKGTSSSFWSSMWSFGLLWILGPIYQSFLAFFFLTISGFIGYSFGCLSCPFEYLRLITSIVYLSGYPTGYGWKDFFLPSQHNLSNSHRFIENPFRVMQKGRNCLNGP